MAIIIGSEIKKAELQNIELDYNMEIDLINKTLKKMENFPTVVMEDNNSISIVMKAPLEYNGVDLMGTNCIVKYNTSWVDENGKNSAGQVDLTNTCIEKQDCLLYTWVLDINQTLKTGVCNFNVIFLMNLEEDPYINNTNVFITDEIEGELSYDSNNVIETNLKYWTISTKPEAINIQNSFSNIESDYNLILPENFAEELQKTNEKVENIEIDIEKCATKDELITEVATDPTYGNGFVVQPRGDKTPTVSVIKCVEPDVGPVENAILYIGYDYITLSGGDSFNASNYINETEFIPNLIGVKSNGEEVDFGQPSIHRNYINNANYHIIFCTFGNIIEENEIKEYSTFFLKYYLEDFGIEKNIIYRIIGDISTYEDYYIVINHTSKYNSINQNYEYIFPSNGNVFNTNSFSVTTDSNGCYSYSSEEIPEHWPDTIIIYPTVENFGYYKLEANKIITSTIADFATKAYIKSERAIDAINDLPKQQDYIRAYGETIVEGVTWTWEKWNNGTIKMWCKAITSNTNEYIATAHISYPIGITLVEEGCAFVTIRSGFQNLGFGLDINAKAIAARTQATVYVHKHSGGLTEDNSNIPVSLFIIGKWK